MAYVRSSADLGADKAAGWAKLVADQFAPVDLSVGDAARFSGTWIRGRLGSLSINHISTTFEHAVRTAKHVAADRSPSFVLVDVKEGTVCVEQFGREYALNPGDYALHFDGAPFRYGHDRPARVTFISSSS